MLNSEIRHRVVVEGADQAKKDYNELADAMKKPAEEADRAGSAFNELFKVEGRLGQALTALGPEAVAAGAVIGGLAAGAAAAAAAAVALTASLIKLGEAGSEVERAGRAFDRVAGPQTAARLDAVTGGIARATAAQRAYAQAFTSGAGEDAILRYFELTSVRASEMGQDIEEALSRAGDAMAEMSSDDIQGRLRELEAIFGDQEVQLRSVGDAWAHVENNAGDAFDRMAEGFARNPEMIQSLSNLSLAIDGNGIAWEAYGDAIGRGTARLMTAGRVFLALSARSPIEGLIGAFNVLSSEGPVAPPPSPGEAEISGLGSRGASLEAHVAQGARTAEYYRTHMAPAGSSGGGGRSREAFSPEMDFSTEGALEAEERFWSERNDAATLFGEILDQQTEGIIAQQEALRTLKDEDESRLANIAEQQAALHDAQMERAEELVAAEDKLREAQQRRFQSAIDNISAMADFAAIAGKIFGDVASQQEAQGKNADGWRKAQGTALGIMYAIKAIAAGGEAIGMIGEMNYSGAALKAVEAVQLGVASGYAFSRLAESGGGGMAAPSSAGTFVAARPDRLGAASTASSEPTTLNIFALGSGNPEVGEAMERARYDLVRSGRTTRAAGRSVGYQG